MNEAVSNSNIPTSMSDELEGRIGGSNSVADFGVGRGVSPFSILTLYRLAFVVALFGW